MLLNSLSKCIYTHRDIRPEWQDIFHLKTELWKVRNEILTNNQSCDLNHVHLQRILSSLKNNKSIDPDGLQNEIFKPGCMGGDLLQALLCLFNYCKNNQSIPQ